MNGKKIIISILCVILILTASVVPMLFVVGASASDHDYSKPGSYFNTAFTSADLLEYIGFELSDAERAYLEEYGDFKINYESVTTQQITVVSNDVEVQVIARPYTFTSASSETVTWIPTSVSIDGATLLLTEENGAYVTRIDASLVDENSTVDVSYRLDGTEIFISASDINGVLNLAYLEAPSIKERVEAARVDYDAKKSVYDVYYAANRQAVDKYYFDKEQYRNYLSNKLVYDEKNSAYIEYSQALERYNSTLKDYNEYVKALDEYNTIIDNNLNYAENYKKYQAEKEKYDAYLPKITVVREQLKVLDDGLFVKATYLKRQLYSALFSNLIDEIISNKEIYINMFGVDEKIIDGCVKASNNVRAILEPKDGKAYKKLKTEEEKYEFYINNRDALCDAVTHLAQCLHELYSYDQIKIAMHAAPTLMGRADYTEKLSILISQLIMFANALSDEPIMSFDGKTVLDKNTKFSYWNKEGEEIKNRTAFDVLEKNDYIKDSGNAKPIPGGYPTEVKEPIEPIYIDKVPNKPTEVLRPIAPEEVEHPGDEPIKVSEPTVPDGFIEEPIKPEELDNHIYSLIISELDSGNLELREEVTDGVTYTPTVTLTKRIYSTDAVTVTFTDGKGGVLSEVSVDKGTSANFIGDLPTKAEDVSATYTFSAWVDVDGNLFDLSTVTEDVTLYPLFAPDYKTYDINYNVDGKGKNQINVHAPDVTLDYLPIDHFITLAEEGLAELLVKAENVTLKLSYSSLLQLKAAGVSSIRVGLDTSIRGAYTCELIPMNDRGETVDVSVRVAVSIPCTDDTVANKSSLYFFNGSEKVYINKSYSNAEIKYDALTGRLYHLTLMYLVKVSSNVADMVSAPENSVPGQTVSLTLNVPNGSVLELYYVLESDPKTKHPIVGTTLVMPSENIRIGANVIQLDYTVIFVNDGKEISNKQYKYGDTVRIPNNPTKLSDDEYSYKFIGWSPEVTTVTGDVTYVAQYESIPLPEVETEFPWFTVLFKSFVTLVILGVSSLVVFILNKKGIINVKNIVDSVKRKLTRSGNKDQNESAEESTVNSDTLQVGENTESVSKNTDADKLAEDIELDAVSYDTEDGAENTESEEETDGADTQN